MDWASRSAYDGWVDLSPTLRAQLDGLSPYIDDPDVDEVLVAAPDRVFIRRGRQQQSAAISISERWIRSLADRLSRGLGRRSDDSAPAVIAGRLPPDLSVVVIGGPHAGACPKIRFVREAGVPRTLETMTAAGALNAAQAESLRRTVDARRTVIFVGPNGVDGREWVEALARQWHDKSRVVALADKAAAEVSEGVAHLTVDLEEGFEAALAVDPDVLVLPDPLPRVWATLTEAGRPFVATLEAPDPRTAVERMIAWVLTSGPTLSRAAAEALVTASVDRIAMLSIGASSARSSLEGQWRARIVSGRVSLERVEPSESSVAAALGMANGARRASIGGRSPRAAVADPERTPTRVHGESDRFGLLTPIDARAGDWGDGRALDTPDPVAAAAGKSSLGASSPARGLSTDAHEHPTKAALSPAEPGPFGDGLHEGQAPRGDAIGAGRRDAEWIASNSKSVGRHAPPRADQRVGATAPRATTAPGSRWGFGPVSR